MRRNLSHLIFWCCWSCGHERKAKKQGKKKQQKNKKGHKKKQKNKEGGKKKKQEKERDREWKGERKEGNERGKKIETARKKNSLSGGKQCYCKQTKKETKRKARFRANCPKTHVKVCVYPSGRRERRKEQNTKRKERAFAKLTLTNLQKRYRKKRSKNHRKTRKNHPHRSRKQISGSGPNRTKPRRRCKFENAPKSSEIGPRPGKMGKTSFSKSPRFCSPRPFFGFQNQFGQKFELPKKQICETPKKLRQKWTATWRRYNRSNAIQPGPATQNCSETPCFEAFRVPLPLGLRLEEPRPETHAKKENLFGPKKTTSTTSKMAFLKNPKNPKTVRIFGFRTPQRKPFRAIKTVVSKRGGRKSALGGPQIDPRNPFWGATNRPSSTYIYIYIIFSLLKMAQIIRKGSKNDPKCCWKSFSPSLLLLRSTLLALCCNFFTAQTLHNFKYLFSLRRPAGVATLTDFESARPALGWPAFSDQKKEVPVAPSREGWCMMSTYDVIWVCFCPGLL